LSNIRVGYSGLIAFVVGIISLFTGLVFILLITRRLTPEEFGLWALIGSITTYFLLSEITISYWTTRQIARNEDIGRTAVVSSGLFSLMTIPLYIIYISVISERSNSDFETMLLGVFLLPVYFISQTLRRVNLGFKPQATSYTLLIFEITKIPIALSLVVLLELGVQGAIIAILFAYIIRIVVQLYFAKDKLQNNFSFQTLKRWIKMSWIPLYNTLSSYIKSLDIVLYSVIVGSVIGVAFYQAGITIAAIVYQSALISQALYPKILAEKKYEKITENLSRTMYFMIPLLAIAILFSKAGLFTLNPAYVGGSLIVIFLALKYFLTVLRNIPQSILLGIEQVDVETNPKFSSLVKSKLFLIPTIYSIFNAVYIILLIILLFQFSSTEDNELELVTSWAIIGFIIDIPPTILLWIYAKKNMDFSFPFSNTLKYIAATIVFSIVFFVTSDFIINYNISIYDFLRFLHRIFCYV
jgi:O-antigen/teichoic acid export membrane protein